MNATVAQPRRFRFTLLNVLLLLTAVAMALGLWSAWRNNVEIELRTARQLAAAEAKMVALEAENARMRQENGYLTIKEPKKVHAVRLKSDQPRSWRYRVYLPEGRTYYFASQVNSLPKGKAAPAIEGRPPGKNGISNLGRDSVGIGCRPGEYVVTFTVKQDKERWGYLLRVVKSGSAETGDSVGSAISLKGDEWPATNAASSTSGVADQVEQPTEGLPLVLLNHRALMEDFRQSLDSPFGAMVWLGVGPSDNDE